MRKWGPKSSQVRATLDSRLKKVFDRVLHEVADISLISGHRGKEEQNRLFAERKSTLEFPQSKHNAYPSLAVDFQPHPYPVQLNKLWGALGYIAGHAIRIGQEEGVVLRWGGDWNRNGNLLDQKFDDLFHMEIVECESSSPSVPFAYSQPAPSP